ncbi:undecaprenyl pyrophosphate phosphatase [Crateriforma conspicua]|uniref:Undecaprenyl pyrophosphate phosphatase n=2 Tax=Crateriforma conspicua TaxID=2527996 RepID=A0A5C5Y8E7_9PLAN|nr:undecaprenyl pyrophosphate phosphatase [Crateriforma conspicua]TWT70701.1 undecaprenyl pyrophosphate phosphatase [Crateriforma conspicua]
MKGGNPRTKTDRNRHFPRLIRSGSATLIHFIRGREPIAMLVWVTVVLGIWGFVELADEVTEGSTRNFDRWAVSLMRQSDAPSIPIGPKWMGEAGRDITALGGIANLTLLIVAATGFLLVNRARRLAAILVASTTSGIAISLLLKRVFDRPRPDVVPHLSDVYTSSFPSGHSMMSAVVYLTLGVLIIPVLKHFWARVYVLATAALVTVLVGISRVYMGVHYPTDVLAGWAAGGVWALICWSIARRSTPKPPSDTLVPAREPKL